MADVEKQAQAEKELGNAAYKKKDFDTAHQHYDKAIQLDPNNITFYTNKAAVYFEQANYGECIKTCEQAVTVGRDSRADYKLIAKAYVRMGNAYKKQDDLENALLNLNKSLAEHRNQDVVKQVHEIEKLKKERDRLASINPEISLEEKNKGNVFFKEGKWPDAIKCYTEAIKRNPDDAKIHSNRAACYAKLMEFSLALKDCEECIRLDPGFIKGYLRKATCLVAMKDTAKAQDAFQKALEIDPKCQEALQGYRQCLDSESPEDVKRRAMADPEVQQILNDPAMRMILDQMQNDPKAAREHLKNPDVSAKIEKLLTSGLIAFR